MPLACCSAETYESSLLVGSGGCCPGDRSSTTLRSTETMSVLARWGCSRSSSSSSAEAGKESCAPTANQKRCLVPQASRLQGPARKDPDAPPIQPTAFSARAPNTLPTSTSALPPTPQPTKRTPTTGGVGRVVVMCCSVKQPQRTSGGHNWSEWLYRDQVEGSRRLAT